MDGRRLYLRAGDPVRHVTRRTWGIGVVVECANSIVPGGACLIRVRFTDGRMRCFENDLDNPNCCYYFGLRHYEDLDNPYEEPRGRRVRRPLPPLPSPLLWALRNADPSRQLAATSADDDEHGDGDGDGDGDGNGNGNGNGNAAAKNGGRRGPTPDAEWFTRRQPPAPLVPGPPRTGGPLVVHGANSRAATAAARLTRRRKRP